MSLRGTSEVCPPVAVEPEPWTRGVEVLQEVRVLEGAEVTIEAPLVMVAVTRSFRVRLADGHTVHERAEAVMAELVELSEDGSILDSAVSSDSERAIVDIEVTVNATDLDDGIARSMAAMRTAIHAVGDATPGWPSHKDVMEMIAQTMHAELVDAS